MSRFVLTSNHFSYGENGSFSSSVLVISVKGSYPNILKDLMEELKSEKYSFPQSFIDEIINRSKDDHYVIGDKFHRPLIAFKIHEYKESE